MKYGFCSWSFSPDIEQAIQWSNMVGADCISLEFRSDKNGKFPLSNPTYQEKIVQLSKQLSVELSCLGVNELCQQGMSRPEKEDVVLDILDQALQAAVAMNIPMLQLPSFVDGKIQTPKDFQQTAKCLQYICQKALNHHIQIGHESCLTADQNLQMQRMVGYDNLFVYFDGANLVRANAENPIQMIQKLHEKIRQVHIKEVYSSTDSPTILGNGNGQVLQTIDALIQHGYTGAWIIEENYLDCPQQAKTDLEHLRFWVEFKG